ncbi:MAG: hypothetical protein LC624_02775 [Halobacteriales archaeon]|nr:hypothetical protein [Halobacteriales archaeon]
MFIVVARDTRQGKTLVLEHFGSEDQATERLAALTQQHWDEGHVQVDGFEAESLEQFLAAHPVYR